MNKSLFIPMFIVSLLTVSCRRQASPSTEDSVAQIEFLGETKYKFGHFSKPDTLVHYFVYKNIGKEPFVIQKVEPSCHCVKPIYSKQPLPPGGVDSIGMVYDGNGYSPGFFIKRCDVYGMLYCIAVMAVIAICEEKFLIWYLPNPSIPLLSLKTTSRDHWRTLYGCYQG